MKGKTGAALRVSFEPSADLYPFESRWHTSEVGRVHYIDEGWGRPILLLHGNPTWSFLYREIVKRLRPDFRCVAVDYPGFGLSDRPPGYGYTPEEHAEVVAGLIEELDLTDLVVMGQDWGGPIGLACGTRMPERVRGLVLGNTWFWPTDRLLNRLFSWIMSARLLGWAIVERNFFVERLIPLGTARSLPEEVMDHYRRAQPVPEARQGVAEFPRQLTAASEWLGQLSRDVVRLLADRPVLLTWGMRDLAFSPGHFLPRFRSIFADRVEIPLPEAKHFIQEDAPGQIAEAIRARFGRATRPGSAPGRPPPAVSDS